MSNLLIFLVCFLFFLVGCKNKNNEKSDGYYINSEIAAEKLYLIAATSKKLHATDNKQNRDNYTRAITKAYLIGIINEMPINVISESVDVEPKTFFNIKDPLKWKEYIEGGATIKNESDIGLIVLEGQPLKYSRLIIDAVAYDKNKFVFNDELNYEELGISVMKEMYSAKKVYKEYIRDLKNDGAQWVERK